MRIAGSRQAFDRRCEVLHPTKDQRVHKIRPRDFTLAFDESLFGEFVRLSGQNKLQGLRQPKKISISNISLQVNNIYFIIWLNSIFRLISIKLMRMGHGFCAHAGSKPKRVGIIMPTLLQLRHLANQVLPRSVGCI